jgi:hypothetical protein
MTHLITCYETATNTSIAVAKVGRDERQTRTDYSRTQRLNVVMGG